MRTENLAKPNYQYEKRQKELAKKAKQEEKRQRKQAPTGAEQQTDAGESSADSHGEQ